MDAKDLPPFECKVCGECCREDQAVWLSEADLEALAQHLSLTLQALIDGRYVVMEEGQNGVVRAKMRFASTPVGKSCPFLVNDLDENHRLWGKCSLHETQAKPLVCRLAPLARSVDVNTGEEEWRVVPPVLGCPGWEKGQEPPPEGWLISEPSLDEKIRRDLDKETEEFSRLSEHLK